jgi:hypothetical protein
VIGAFLFILGLAVAWNGYGYVQVERGWTLVISGTVAFSTGLLLVALGLVLRELRAISASAGRATLLLARGRAPQLSDFEEPPQEELEDQIPERVQQPPQAPPPQFQPAREELAPFDPSQEEERFDAPVAREHEPEPERSAERALQRRLPRVSEALAGAGAAANPLAWMIRPERPEPRPPIEDKPAYAPVAWSVPAREETPPEVFPREEALEDALPVAEPEASPPEPEDLSGSLDAPEPALEPEERAPEPAPETDLEPAQEPEPQPHDVEPAPEPDPEPAPEPDPEPAPEAIHAEASDKEIIGQYDAQGAHYIMYADGSIDAETAHGVYRFASMEELKQFIERQG